MVHDLAALHFEAPQAEARAEIGRPGRELCLYPGKLGYELQDELDFLSNRAMEPNVFSPAVSSPPPCRGSKTGR